MDLTSTLSTATVQDVLNIMAENATNDDFLEELFRAVKRFKSDIWLEVKNEFSVVCYFYEDSLNGFIAKLSKQCIRKIEKTNHYEDIININNGDLEGVELKHCSREQFAVFSKEAYVDGMVRFTVFDANGFESHTTRATYELSAMEAVKDGFIYPVNGALEKLFNTTSWWP